MEKLDSLQAYVTKLRDYDHAFLTVKGAHYFSEPFGFTARTHYAEATPHLPKGLTFNDGRAGAEGIDAQDLAMQICDHVGVEYPEMFGRGSQLRVCCDALDRWLESKCEHEWVLDEANIDVCAKCGVEKGE